MNSSAKTNRWYRNAYGEIKEWVWFTGVLTTVLLLIALWVWAISGLIIRFERQDCQAYSEKTLQDADFVHTTFMNCECFVRVDEHWVLREQIRIVGNQP